MGLYVNLLTASASFSLVSYLCLPTTPSCLTPPLHSHTHPCPPVCLASGSDTQYPHCVAALQQGRGKKSIYQQSVPSTALFCAHTKKQLPSMFQLKSKHKRYETAACHSLFMKPVPAFVFYLTKACHKCGWIFFFCQRLFPLIIPLKFIVLYFILAVPLHIPV